MVNRHTFVRFATIAAFLSCCGSAALCQSASVPAKNSTISVLGLWRGDSICVSANRPACKNEIVVYQIETIPGKPDIALMFADKIINGERVPMGKMEFQYDEAKGTISSEFTRGRTHGLWQYAVNGDSMLGTLVILPDKEIGRRVWQSG